VERRGGTPMLSDLRESGAIEQDADIVCFLYGHSEAEVLHNPDLKNEIMLKIAKHRNGELDTVYFNFEKEYQRFVGKEASAANSLSFDAPF
ncbi:MAG: replicative DNA helicase, partial [Proteobacteria bacterium]